MKGRSKTQLYRMAAGLRKRLAIAVRTTPSAVYHHALTLPNLEIRRVPFRTRALRGMAIPDQEGGVDIILLNSGLQSHELDFYCAHELMHIFYHRNENKGSFSCYDMSHPTSDRFLEWQANEGAAELVMPYPLVLDMLLEQRELLYSYQGIQSIQLALMQRFQVTHSMARLRLESLKGEIWQYLHGVPMEKVILCSAAQRKNMGLHIPTLSDYENHLRIQAKRRCCIDITAD